MKLAFIGMGNMAYAILKGGCDRGFFNPAHVSAYDINTVRLAEVAAETGITGRCLHCGNCPSGRYGPAGSKAQCG